MILLINIHGLTLIAAVNHNFTITRTSGQHLLDLRFQNEMGRRVVKLRQPERRPLEVRTVLRGLMWAGRGRKKLASRCHQITPWWAVPPAMFPKLVHSVHGVV